MNAPARTARDGLDPIDVKRMAIQLSDGKFHKGATIGIPPRTVRAIVAAYPDEYIATQSGFKMLRYAKDGEIHIAVADLRSRARHLNERADGHEKALRSRGGQKELFSL